MRVSEYVPVFVSEYVPVYVSEYVPVYVSEYVPVFVSEYVPVSVSEYVPVSVLEYVPVSVLEYVTRYGRYENLFGFPMRTLVRITKRCKQLPGYSTDSHLRSRFFSAITKLRRAVTRVCARLVEKVLNRLTRRWTDICLGIKQLRDHHAARIMSKYQFGKGAEPTSINELKGV